MSQTLLEMAKDLVLAQINVHRLSPEDMHAALQDIYSSLLALHAQEASHGRGAVETPETPPAPINWRKSITKQTVTLSGVWRPLQATVGASSQGTWVGCAVISRQIWDASAPAAVRSLSDRPPQTDRAAVETVGKGADVSEGARAGGTGCRSENEASAEERDSEGEEVVEAHGAILILPFVYYTNAPCHTLTSWHACCCIG